MMLKVEEKTLNICEGHTKILVCTTSGLNVLKNPPEAAKVATLVKFFNVKKPRHVSLIKILRYNFFQMCLTHMSTAKCVLQRVRYHHIKGRRNIWYKNIDNENNNIFFV